MQKDPFNQFMRVNNLTLWIIVTQCGWPLRTLTHLSTSDVIWMEDVVVVVRSGEHSVTVSTEFRATSCQPCERGHRCFTSRFNPPSVLSFRLVTGKQGWMGFLLLTRYDYEVPLSHWYGRLNMLYAPVQIISECCLLKAEEFYLFFFCLSLQLADFIRERFVSQKQLI